MDMEININPPEKLFWAPSNIYVLQQMFLKRIKISCRKNIISTTNSVQG